MTNHKCALIVVTLLATAVTAAGQTPLTLRAGAPLVARQQPAAGTQAAGPSLALKDAQDLALKNHPKLLAAQDEASASGQAVREFRSMYFPTIEGAVTGAQGSENSRIGAGGVLSASRLFNRLGEGVTLAGVG